jgi:sugar diacid utilization regulator
MTETRVLRDLVAMYRHLSGLAAQNADIATVVQLIAERTATTIAMVSQAMDVLAAAAPGASQARAAEYVQELVDQPRLGEALAAAGQTRRALRLPDLDGSGSVIVAPILVGDDVPSYLVTLDPGERHAGEDVSLLLTEHAATICGVILSRERVVAAAASRVRDDLLEGLLSGRGEQGEPERWAKHLGYDAEREHHVLAVAVDVPGAEVDEGRAAALRRRAGAAVEQFFAARAPDAITQVGDAEVVVVLPEPVGDRAASRATHLGQLCVNQVRELSPEVVVTIGIGGSCRQPADVARSYAEARRTIDMVRRMGRQGCVVAFDALDIQRLLLQVPDLSELRGFAMAVLGKLSLHEREHKSEYLSTLACYFRESCSPQRASRYLHVHPNTVTYRIRRIEEITGLRFDNYRDRLMAQVALEILDAVGDGQ